MSNFTVDLTLRLHNELSKGIGAARTDMRGLRDEAGKLGQTKGGDKLSTDLKKVEGAATAARQDIAGMRAEAQRLATATGGRQIARDMRGAGTAASTARTDIAGMRAEAGRLGQSAGAKQLARDLAGIGTAAEKSTNALERTRRAGANIRAGRPTLEGVPPPRSPEKKQKATNGNVVAAGRSAIGATIGGLTVAEGYKQAAQFDRRMTMIGQTADASREQIDALGTAVHDLAQQTATPVDNVAGGLEALVAQGRSLKEGLEFLPSVARTAAATGSAVDDIAKSADSVSSNFSIAGKEMQAAFDIMAAGGKAGQFELKDMARYLPSLSPAAKAAGFKGSKGLADIVSMLQIIRKGSGSAEEAATSMTNVFTKLESEETTKSFKKMGVDLEEAMKKGRKEGRNLVEVLEEATQKATKGDLSLLPKLFKDQEFARGMRALMTYRGEWQKLSGTLQTGSDGTVMRDLVQVTKDAQASVDRLSNSWARFIQTASRMADAGGVSAGLGDTATEFQNIAVALERINKAYAEGGLKGAFNQATGDAAERMRENRKAWLDNRGKQEDGRVAELEADNKAFREKLEREGHSPESIDKTMRLRQAEVEKARRRKAAVDKARQDPALADRKPLRMGVDPAAPLQGPSEVIGKGEGSNHGKAFNEAFPIDLEKRHPLPSSTPLPPARPNNLPRSIGTIDEVLGPPERTPSTPPTAPVPATPAPVPVPEPERVSAATAALAGYRTELESITRQLDGLKASGEGAFSPETAGLEARKAELEALISSIRASAEGAAAAVKQALGADLSGEGQKAGASYATGLATGGATAEATATGTATSVKGALDVDAAAEGQKVGASYAAGIQTGRAAAIAAAASTAAGVRAALAGAGGGTGTGTAGVKAIRQSLSTPTIAPAGVAAMRQAAAIPPTQPAAVRTASNSAGGADGGRGGGRAGAGGGGGGATTVNVGGITVNGAGDPDRVARKVGAELASAIDRNRSGALHDGVVG